MFGSEDGTDTNEVPEDTIATEEKEHEVEAEPLETTDSSSNIETDSADEPVIGDCEENYPIFLEKLPDNFPMPDECAVIDNVLVDDSRVDANYDVEGDWSELYNFYKDYYGDNIDEQNQILNEKRGILSGKIDGGKLEITVKEIEDNNVNVRTFYRFP